MKATLALLLPALLAALAGNVRADADTRVYQQRLADGRVVLSDRPIDGAAIQRTWQIAREEPEAARQRSELVRLEAQQVAERIQRRIEREQASADALEADRLRSRLAETRRAAELGRDDASEPTALFVPGLLRRPDRSLLPPHRSHLRPDRQQHRPHERSLHPRFARRADEELR